MAEHLLTGADLGMFSSFGQTGAPQKEGLAGQSMLDVGATFSGMGALCGVL